MVSNTLTFNLYPVHFTKYIILHKKHFSVIEDENSLFSPCAILL